MVHGVVKCFEAVQKVLSDGNFLVRMKIHDFLHLGYVQLGNIHLEGFVALIFSMFTC